MRWLIHHHQYREPGGLDWVDPLTPGDLLHAARPQSVRSSGAHVFSLHPPLCWLTSSSCPALRKIACLGLRKIVFTRFLVDLTLPRRAFWQLQRKGKQTRLRHGQWGCKTEKVRFLGMGGKKETCVLLGLAGWGHLAYGSFPHSSGCWAFQGILHPEVPLQSLNDPWGSFNNCNGETWDCGHWAKQPVTMTTYN